MALVMAIVQISRGSCLQHTAWGIRDEYMSVTCQSCMTAIQIIGIVTSEGELGRMPGLPSSRDKPEERTCNIEMVSLRGKKAGPKPISTTVFFYQRISLRGNLVLVTPWLHETGVSTWTDTAFRGFRRSSIRDFACAGLRHSPVAMPQPSVILLWLRHR
jgi:hypothetical protein